MNDIYDPDKARTINDLLIKSLIWVVIVFLLFIALIFGSAGTLKWVNGWIYIITLFGCVCFNLFILLKINPEVIEERSRMPKGAKKWDLVILSVATVVIIATLIVAGLDKRYDLSRPLSNWWIFIGIIMMIIGDFIDLWAMAVNKWFSKVVAIQTERGHQVITTGPYHYVRHPGYVGWSLLWLGTPLILDSLWAFVPALLSIILIVIRTVWEDDTLQKELPGYAEYASKVKYRLLPGVW